MSVRLSSLNPTWVNDGDRVGVGVACDCPCGCDVALYVGFANPLDGNPQPSHSLGWQRTGDTFDTLTLTPSIRRLDRCKWHGFIANGEVRTA